MGVQDREDLHGNTLTGAWFCRNNESAGPGTGIFNDALSHNPSLFSADTSHFSKCHRCDGTVRCSCSNTLKPYFIASKCQKEIYTSDLKNVPTEYPGGGTSFA